jgi:hypothetical protein
MKTVYTGPKIFTADIETLPLQTYNWSLWDEPRALDRLVKDWAIFSVAGKWLHEKKVQYIDTKDQESAAEDKELLIWLREMLHEADIVVGQNVQKFDMRKIRARMIHHGLKPFREPAIVDTMLMAREVGAFTSNKLEYLSTLTDEQKSKHGKYPGFSLWLGIMNNEAGAWAECKKYNKQDVVATEKLYLLLRPWARRLPNMSHYYADDKQRCPRCGGEHLTAGEVIFRGVSEYQTYECNSCGGHSRTRFTLNTKGKRKSLLAVI